MKRLAGGWPLAIRTAFTAGAGQSNVDINIQFYKSNFILTVFTFDFNLN